MTPPSPPPVTPPVPPVVPTPVTGLGVDVSGAQTVKQVQAAALTSDFILVKASEGQSWKSPAYSAEYAAAVAGCSLVGAYHFAWPNQDPAREADNFVTAAMLKPGDLAALDLERSTAGESWATRVTYALAWLRAVSDATKARPLLYVNPSWLEGLRGAASAAQWAELSTYPLWLAHWTGTPGQHADTHGWQVHVHQYEVAGGLDRDWTPDMAALRGCAVP